MRFTTSQYFVAFGSSAQPTSAASPIAAARPAAAAPGIALGTPSDASDASTPHRGTAGGQHHRDAIVAGARRQAQKIPGGRGAPPPAPRVDTVGRPDVPSVRTR